MPQLDPSSLPSQLFWLAITFYILYRLMADRVLPRIAEVLEERSERISNDLEQAEALKKSAEEVIKAYEDELAKARTNAQAAIAKVQREVSDYASQRQQEESTKWAERIAEAELRIAAAKRTAEADLKNMVTDVSHDLTVKLTGIAPSRKAMSKAIDEALGEHG